MISSTITGFTLQFLIFAAVACRVLAIAPGNDSNCLKGLRDSFYCGGALTNWTSFPFEAGPCGNTSIPIAGIACYEGRVFSIRLAGYGLAGTISPSITDCTYVRIVDVSSNQLSGHLPTSISNLSYLANFNISNNLLTGSIPVGLSVCSYLNFLDLHDNQLNGSIPGQIGLLQSLIIFNVSSNQLSGQIPTSLSNSSTGAPRFGASSFFGNEDLYGYPLSPMPPPVNHSLSVLATVVIVLAGILVFLAIAVNLPAFQRFKSRDRLRSRGEKLATTDQLVRASALDLFNATNGYSNDCIIGSGGSSTVYRAVFPNQEVIAVKKFKLEDSSKARRLFARECQTLGMVRHRNLVKILGCCCNLDVVALLLEFMPNGSLEEHLHGHGAGQLTWAKRYNIAIGVASSLHYLHHECGIGPVIHCDLKPSNILLDEDFEAHVTDFGISRVIHQSSGTSCFSFASSFTGTIGYAPPEYASLGGGTAEGDVYSYGIIILEMVTGKCSTSDMFDERLSFRGWVQAILAGNVLERAIDSALQQEVAANEIAMVGLLKIGLHCSQISAKHRPRMSDVLFMLSQIKPHD